MKRFPLHLLLTLFLVVPFAACDSDGDDDDNGNGNGNIGDAEVTVSGDVDDSFSGNAYFAVEDDDEGNPSFVIGLFSGSITNPTGGQIVALTRDGERPGVGTYTIESDDTEATFQGGYTNFEGAAGDVTAATSVLADAGTLTITSSSDDRVVGSFTFTGQAFSGTGALGTATVEGEFTAEFVDATNVPTLP